jgi:hypothetical protein
VVDKSNGFSLGEALGFEQELRMYGTEGGNQQGGVRRT